MVALPKPAELIDILLRLNRAEEELSKLGPRTRKRLPLEAELGGLREKLPRPMLSHHDRIRALGRASVAVVRDWICRGCFLSVPSGLRVSLAQKHDIHLCENCGAYIYLAPVEPEPTAAAVTPAKPGAKKKPLKRAPVAPSARARIPARNNAERKPARRPVRSRS